MGEEIELEGFAQAFRRPPRRCCPARPRPHWRPRCRRRRRFRPPCRRPRAHRPDSVTSQASASAVPADLLWRLLSPLRDRGRGWRLPRLLRPSRLRGCRADARAAAGDDRDLPRQHLLRGLAELGLFQRPIFDIEHVGFGDAAIFAMRFRIGDDVDGVLRDVGGDGRILRRCAKPEQAHARHQHHARQRIEFGFLRLGAFIVAREIVVIVRDEFVDRRARPISSIRPACPLRARARAAASSWCGWCDRA